MELHNLRHDLEGQCDEAVETAIAHERRHYEPDMAALTAERDRWQSAAEDALHGLGLWRTLAIGAGIAAAGLGLVLVIGL